MLKEQGILRQVLLWLSERYATWRRDPGAALEVHDKVSSNYVAIEIDELESLTSGREFTTGGRFIFLEPVEKQGLVQPILSLNYNFNRKIPELRLQLALFSLSNDQLAAIGLRFETPEGHGVHNYYHSQLVTSLRLQSGHQPLPCAQWLPTSYPALVIDATNVVSFLVCVVLSLYGRHYENELLACRFKEAIRAYVEELGWRDVGSGKNNRLVEDESGKWYVRLRD
jgi:hypothetical protein